ncbi:hypothetical protein SF06_30340 [Pseudomonas flexibilis]|nr:hypothetical protein SF06_30340 [Pseudomonas flexibilis]
MRHARAWPPGNGIGYPSTSSPGGVKPPGPPHRSLSRSPHEACDPAPRRAVARLPVLAPDGCWGSAPTHP